MEDKNGQSWTMREKHFYCFICYIQAMADVQFLKKQCKCTVSLKLLDSLASLVKYANYMSSTLFISLTH